jgi:tyrosine aminotransferase
MGNLTSTVPVICLGAISKIYCLPGWRLGWTIVYNNSGYFDNVIQGLSKHSLILLHPNSLVQHALPKILKNVPESYFDNLKLKLKTSADVAFERLSTIKGIKPMKSSAAMYMMVGFEIELFKDIVDDLDFCRKLRIE